MRSKVAKFQRRLWTQTLLDGPTPLLDILRRRVEFHGGEANGSCAQDRRPEVEVTRNDTSGRREIVTLLRFRKDVGNIVALVAPGIHVHRREEDPKRRMEHKSMIGDAVRNARTRREVKLVRSRQSFWKPLLATDENGRRAIDEGKIGVGVTNVTKRTHEFVTHSDLNRRVASHLETVLHETICIPLAELHLRNAGLALLHRG